MEVYNMFNMIKMNLYRLFHQKAFYIIPAVSAIVSCFMVYMVWMVPKLENQTAQLQTEAGLHAGVAVGSPDSEPSPLIGSFNLTEFMDEILGSGILIIMISAGAAIIANSERKNGFIKNLAGQIAPRGLLTVTKLPGMLLESILILVFSLIGCALPGRLLFATFTLGSLSALVKALAVHMLLSTALCALILMICTLSENAASGIITGIVLSAGLLPFLYMLIDKVLWNYFHVPESFDLNRYSLSGHLMSVASTSDTGALVLALAVGAVYLAVCSIGSYVIIKKKDIA